MNSLSRASTQIQFHPQKFAVIRINPNRHRLINTSYQIHGHTLEVVDSSNFLESPSVKTLPRENNTVSVNKANKTHGFFWQNLSDFFASVRSAAFTTMIRRLGIFIHRLRPPLGRDIHNLEQVKCISVRFINRNYMDQKDG